LLRNVTAEKLTKNFRAFSKKSMHSVNRPLAQLPDDGFCLFLRLASLLFPSVAMLRVVKSALRGIKNSLKSVRRSVVQEV
jgi:hypothetical protein